MSQNFQALDPKARFADLPCVVHDPLAVEPLAGQEEANWEIREFSLDEAEFEELTKMFVPFEPDIS